MALRQGRLVLIALLVLLLATVWRTVSVEHDKRRLATEYETARQALLRMEAEQLQLANELKTSQGTVEQQTQSLTDLQQELGQVQEKLTQTVTELSILQQQHEQLRESNASLTTQLTSLTAEKQQLEAKLSNLKDLRLAIHNVKRKLWAQRWASWRAREQLQREADLEALASGNHGYVMRNGASTLGSGTRLRVQVLEPQSQ